MPPIFATILILFLLYLSALIPWSIIIFLLFILLTIFQKKKLKYLNWKKALLISCIISLLATILPAIKEIEDNNSKIDFKTEQE